MDDDLLPYFNEKVRYKIISCKRSTNDICTVMQKSEVLKGITTLTITNVVFNSGGGKKKTV